MGKQNVDWEKVEMEFRAGMLSVRSFARNYNVVERTIRRRAKRDNWLRDLADRSR
jgi:hypothetical protein